MPHRVCFVFYKSTDERIAAVFFSAAGSINHKSLKIPISNLSVVYLCVLCSRSETLEAILQCWGQMSGQRKQVDFSGIFLPSL